MPTQSHILKCACPKPFRTSTTKLVGFGQVRFTDEHDCWDWPTYKVVDDVVKVKTIKVLPRWPSARVLSFC